MNLSSAEINDIIRPKCYRVWAVYAGDTLLGCSGTLEQAERFRQHEPWAIVERPWTFRQALNACNAADGTTPTQIGKMVHNVQCRGVHHVG